jgi:hypothetical protein
MPAFSRSFSSTRADFGEVVRVRLYDPADRGSGASVVIDRLP